MKNLNLTKPSGRSLRCLLLIAVLSFMSVASTRSYGQSLTVSAGLSNLCNQNGLCCYHFKFQVAALTGSFSLVVDNPNCWDTTCFKTQSFLIANDPNNSVVSAVTPIHNGWTLTFNPGIGANGQVEFNLCPSGNCNVINSKIIGIGFDNFGIRNYGPDTVILNGCTRGTADCIGCDQTVIYRINDCYHQVCLKRRATGAGSAPGHIKIEFIPPLGPCNGVASGCTQTSITFDPRWVTDAGNPVFDGSGNIVSISINNPDTLKACDEVCFTVPVCDRGVHRVKVTDLNDPHNCGTYPSSSFKIGDKPSSHSVEIGSEPNYPNPVTDASSFRTIIPFSIAESQEARITFIDQTGKLVHTESQTFEGAGKHFFYFTASELPSGTYYYTIESPIGLPIVKRNLLIIK